MRRRDFAKTTATGVIGGAYALTGGDSPARPLGPQRLARLDPGRLFLELSREGVDQILQETVDRSVPTQRWWWGYDVLRIEDPDGNELLICLEW